MIEFKSPKLEEPTFELIGAVLRRSIVKEIGLEIFTDPKRDEETIKTRKY